MNENRMRRRGRLAAIVLAVTALTMPAAPAIAAEKPSADYCWLDVDTQRTSCFPSADALENGIVARTGAPVIEDAAEAARSDDGVAARANYLMARFYEDANYGGAFFIATSTNSSICVTGVISAATMPSGWDNRVSSFASYNGCQSILYTGTSYSGNSESGTSKANLTYNDQASSYKVL